jgi:hypothetical protein
MVSASLQRNLWRLEIDGEAGLGQGPLCGYIMGGACGVRSAKMSNSPIDLPFDRPWRFCEK